MGNLAGIILAAGLSSRMGAYKPLLEVEGVSMVRHVVERMRQAGAQPIFVVTGHRRAELEAHLQGAGVQCIFNPDYATTQQLESLRLALAALPPETRRVMISPADVPLVRPETVRALQAVQADFVRPVYRGEVGHPVFLDTAYVPYLLAYGGPGGLRGAMERSGCVLKELEVADRGTVLDNDTPQDLARLLDWYAGETTTENGA